VGGLEWLDCLEWMISLVEDGLVSVVGYLGCLICICLGQFLSCLRHPLSGLDLVLQLVEAQYWPVGDGTTSSLKVLAGDHMT
jgi:hypothetical protein